MILPILKYGHPVLRKKGALIEEFTPEIERLAADLLETMHAAKGVGLAAQQVGHALHMAAIDVRGVTDRPSTLWRQGQPADIDAFMPLILINPKVTPVGAPVAGPEGCLSFPELYSDVVRPESVEVTARDVRGEPLNFQCGGLLARVIQHELDHLNGILFIDRMSTDGKQELQEQLDTLQAATKNELSQATAKETQLVRY